MFLLKISEVMRTMISIQQQTPCNTTYFLMFSNFCGENQKCPENMYRNGQMNYEMSSLFIFKVETSSDQVTQMTSFQTFTEMFQF